MALYKCIIIIIIIILLLLLADYILRQLCEFLNKFSHFYFSHYSDHKHVLKIFHCSLTICHLTG